MLGGVTMFVLVHGASHGGWCTARVARPNSPRWSQLPHEMD